MCLITINTTETTFTAAWLLDFFEYNADGLGVMYAENGALTVEKFVPTTEAEVLKFYQEHVAGREAVVHWRMKTHGKIDAANAHPYQVLNMKEHGLDLWMVHNGILSGVSSDQKQMSDTWHFIRDTVRPILVKDVDMLRNPAFIELLEDRIGHSNKLVFLDNLGRQTIINEAAFHDFSGAKLSNTYAWSSHSKHNLEAPEAYPVYDKGAYSGYYGKQSKPAKLPVSWTRELEEEDDDEDNSMYYENIWDKETDDVEELADALAVEEYSALETLVYEYPSAIADLLTDYGITVYDVRLACTGHIPLKDAV